MKLSSRLASAKCGCGWEMSLDGSDREAAVEAGASAVRAHASTSGDPACQTAYVEVHETYGA